MTHDRILTVVVPAYNSAAYLDRCISSLLDGAGYDDVEIVIVDDGSWDDTAAIADGYARAHPDIVRVFHQANAGHGGAVNTGVDLARGRYVKVVDSDDWVDPAAYRALLDTLRELERTASDVDLVITNYVYEKVDRKRRATVRYASVLPIGRVFGWEETGRFRKNQYLLMHSLVYRTDLLRECGLQLPEHTFYVDNLYAYIPLAHVRRMYYLDVDLYRYYIGREDQSVNESVMISRMDQQLRVNHLMMESLVEVRQDKDLPRSLRRYLTHYAEIVCAVSSILLIRAGTPDAIARKEAFWREIRALDRGLYRRLRLGLTGQLVHLPGRTGRSVSVLAYKAARRVVGFN